MIIRLLDSWIRKYTTLQNVRARERNSVIRPILNVTMFSSPIPRGHEHHRLHCPRRIGIVAEQTDTHMTAMLCTKKQSSLGNACITRPRAAPLKITGKWWHKKTKFSTHHPANSSVCIRFYREKNSSGMAATRLNWYEGWYASIPTDTHQHSMRLNSSMSNSNEL